MISKAIPTPRPELQQLADRINERIDRSGECWLWTGYLSADGYGAISVGGKPTGAHRAAYETYTGPIPEGMEIDHLCRVRHCVNPAHLEAVTHKVNMQRRDYTPVPKERCKNGHPFDEANTRVSNGKRVCRACRREISRRHREKQAEQAAQVTFRPGIEGLMAALSAAEQLAASSPVVPSHVRIDEHSSWFVDRARPLGVHLYFHRDENAVRAFADSVGAAVQQLDDEADRLTSASGALNGVPFRAWTLTNAEVTAVAA